MEIKTLSKLVHKGAPNNVVAVLELYAYFE